MNEKFINELGVLVGLLLTDGCVSSGKFLVFHNKSEVMHKLFQEKVQKVFGKTHFTERTEVNGTKRTQVTSKRIVNELLRICQLKTFRRKQFENGQFPNTRLPSFVNKLSKRAILKILQAIFSADGSISVSARWRERNKSWEIRRRVELTCKHPRLRNDFFELLTSVGFSPRISDNNITLEKKRDILNFAQKVKFVDGVKIGGDSKHWRGFEKNQILNLAIKTLSFTKKDLEKFESRENIFEFLKSLI